MEKKLSFLFVGFLFCSLSVLAQTAIKGTVVDKDTKEPLIGVSVFSVADKKGTATDLDGSFNLKVTNTSGKVELTYVGYKALTVNASDRMGTIEMETDAIGLRDVVVTSSVAIRRKTPVALSVIEAELLDTKMSTQEFPEILKSTPGVYATKQGGGFGDSRINLRGFSTENIAVMINGVPMNDMEWGGVYWSNWAGLGDVTRSMQVQRGLGAAKVAAPSIGGSINIVTKSTDANKGGSVSYGMGNDGYNKLAFNVSTGLTKDGWAFTFLGSKTWGDGYIMGTEFEAYTWFLNLSKIINDQHQLSLTAFGTPQWHNQRSNSDKLKITEWKRMGDDYTKFNPTFGYDKNGERVDTDRNHYHKPQISLNHFWTMDEKSSLSTAVYLSIGDGGGHRWRGTDSNALYGSSNTTGLLNTEFRDANSPYYMDYAKVQRQNTEEWHNEQGLAYNGARNVITDQINNHTWLGLLSTFTTKLTEEIDFYGGIDFRYYAGKHQEKIKNLMGADFYVDSYRKSAISPNKINDLDWVNEKLKVGDKIYRDNTAYVLQEGVFAQGEYNKDALSVFLSGSLSNSTYWKRDRYYYDDEKSKTKSFLGFNVKGGANYNIDDQHNVFFNAGYLSRAPYMRGGYFTRVDQSNNVNKDAVNEKSYSFEIGYGFRSKYLTANLNLYHTKWMDKTMVRAYGNDYDAFVNLKGIDARHQGIELDFVAKPLNNLEITGMISIGDWIWDSKSTGYIYDSNGNPTTGTAIVPEFSDAHKIVVDMTDVKVGNSAQSTFAIGGKYKCLDGLTLGIDYTYFARNYADYKIDVPNAGGTAKYYTPWRIPSAGVMDLNANYKFTIAGLKTTIYGNINNVLNKEYITDAIDYNPKTEGGHSWTDVGVLYGFGRTYSVSLKVLF